MEAVITYGTGANQVIIGDALKDSAGVSTGFFDYLQAKIVFFFSWLGTLLVTVFNFIIDIAQANQELLIGLLIISGVYYKVTGKIPLIGNIRKKGIH